MANSIIEDGTGTGKKARVDESNRLATISHVESELHVAIDAGDGLLLSTGYVTLTSANASGIVYIVNNDSEDWVISEIRTSISTSTGGATTDVKCEFVKDPTSTTVAGVITPINLLSSHILMADISAYYGAEGNTFTGGTAFNQHFHQTKSEATHQQGEIIYSLAAGKSIGVRVTPPASNTSMQVALNIVIYRKNF